jgi:hypothetical protein
MGQVELDSIGQIGHFIKARGEAIRHKGIGFSRSLRCPQPRRWTPQNHDAVPEVVTFLWTLLARGATASRRPLQAVGRQPPSTRMPGFGLGRRGEAAHGISLYNGTSSGC